MNIQIRKLELTNFKCFRHKEVSFDSNITTIKGRNGAGKTTIADAILWCLFGKNSQGQSDFDLKTHDENGKPIPNLDHSVEMELAVSEGGLAKQVTLKRTLKETWVKKRGSEEQVFKNNTTEYMVNGDVMTASDYKKYIANLINEDIFRAITNPTYFTSLKWQDQREILTRMVGEITGDDIVKEYGDDNLSYALRKTIEADGEDIVSYRKHLSYQIKKVKEQLEKIPVRLEEQNKALPDKLDWANIDTELRNKQTLIKGIEADILAIKQGNGSDVKRQELRNQISVTTAALDKKVYDARSEESKAVNEKNRAVSDLTIKFNEALNNQKLMEQTIEADKRMIARCEETVKDCEAELQHLRDIWPNRKFEVDSNAAYCPTCGQLLPGDMVEEKIESMRKAFNEALEKEKQSLRDRAARVKNNKEGAENGRISSANKLDADNQALAQIKDEINTIFANKAKLEKEPVKTAGKILDEDSQYIELLSQLKQLRSDLDNLSDSDDNREKLTGLEATKAQCEAEIAGLQQQLASKVQYEKILSLISGIEEEQKELVRQLSELERKEDVAARYQERCNKILEERINEHFSLVKWRLFRTVNNGGDPFDEPFCECYVDGVAYHDGLNQAARLNAGLDIINALCKHYNVSAPIVIDNSESNLNILSTTSQQIRLEVFDSELQII